MTQHPDVACWVAAGPMALVPRHPLSVWPFQLALRRRVLKPLMYGYMKVVPGTPDGDIRQMELVLKDYAEREGYDFATIFYEYEADGRALAELMEELKRAEARHVVMPTLEHLSSHAILCDNRLALLEVEAGATVHTLGT